MSVGNSLPFQLINTPDNFSAGKTKLYIDKWDQLTSDKWILQTISGYKVEFDSLPYQTSIPKPLTFNEADQVKINAEIDRFLNADIIEKVLTQDRDEYISNIFFMPKKDGNIRIILNLKSLNKNHMEKIHFKMESLYCAVSEILSILSQWH